MISVNNMSDADVKTYLAEVEADDYLATMDAHQVENI